MWKRNQYGIILILAVAALSMMVLNANAETYYAKIENGIVTNVIVADANFIRSQPGKWIETFKDMPNKNYAGIGHYWNDTTKNTVPIRQPDLIIKTMNVNFTKFLEDVSFGINEYYKIISNKTTVQAK